MAILSAIFGLTILDNGNADVSPANLLQQWNEALAAGILQERDTDGSGTLPTGIEGGLWHIASSPTPAGLWENQGNKLALWINGAWSFTVNDIPDSTRWIDQKGSGVAVPLDYVLRKDGAWHVLQAITS